MADPSERPTGRQRKLPPPPQPTRTQPPRNNKEDGLEPESQCKTTIILHPPKTKITLRIKPEAGIHPQWGYLPLHDPRQIKLKIAITSNQCLFDTVHYAPESTTQGSVVPWKRSTGITLTISYKAVIVTKTEVYGYKTRLMLFGEDMDAAMANKERYEAMEVLEPCMWPYWYGPLMKIWGGASEGVLSIKNIFDKAQQEFVIRNGMELEAHRLRSLVEGVKRDFAKKVGLPVDEVQNIFKNRTDIIVASLSTTTAYSEFEHKVHRIWVEEIGFPEDRLRFVPRAEACAFHHVSNQLQAQTTVSLWQTNPERFYATHHNGTAFVILDVEGCYSGASTIMTLAKAGRCQSRVITEPSCGTHGRGELRKPVRDILEREYGGIITAAAFESNKTYEEILEHLINDFGHALDLFTRESDLAMVFPLGVSVTLQHGHNIAVKDELIMARRYVMRIVNEWLVPIALLAMKQLRALDAVVAAGQAQNLKRRILMTGHGAQSPYVVGAFKAALRNIGLDVKVDVDTTIDNSVCTAMGALWSMTTGQDGYWKTHGDLTGEGAIGNE